MVVPPFGGTEKITDLEAFPLSHLQKDEFTTRLAARGQELTRLAGYQFKSYIGVGYQKGIWGGSIKYNVRYSTCPMLSSITYLQRRLTGV